jgi:hypothetical protein
MVTWKKTLHQIISFVVGAVMLLGVSTSIPVAAQSIQDLDILGIDCLLPGQPGCESEETLVEQLIDFAINTAAVVAVVVIIYGGYMFFFGAVSGDQAKGRNAVAAGVTGLAIVLLGRPIVDLLFGSGPGAGDGIINDGGLNNEPIIRLLEDQVLPFMIGLSSVAAIIVIVVGGYKYMTSALASDQKDGLDTIKNGVIGLVVILLANPIINIVSSTIQTTDGDTGEQELVLDTTTIVGQAGVIINNFLVPLSSVVALFFLVLGAYYWITSNGDENQVKKAQTSIRNAVIGLVVALLGATIVQLIIFFIPLG